MKNNVMGFVILAVVLGITLTSVSVNVLQSKSEVPNQKVEDPDGNKKEKGDNTPPVITIDYLPIGEGTDENPGAWDVFAYDKESGINPDTIKVYIDDILIGNCFGTYEVPCSLGNHTIVVEVKNNLQKNPLEASSSDTILIIDDDATPPELSNLIIEFDVEFVNISLSAFDYSGISEFNILVNEEDITPLNIEVNNNNFIFVLKNQWLSGCSINNVEIQASDADDDRENDSLSSSIYGTFEMGLNEFYQSIICKIESLKIYIESNVELNFKYYMIHKLSLAQESLEDGFYYFEKGEFKKGLVYMLKAGFFLWITERYVKNINGLADDEAKFIIDELLDIRNSIYILIVASLDSDLVYEVASIKINLLNLLDYIRDNMDGCSIRCLQNLIRSSCLKLNYVIIFLLMEKNPYHILDCLQFKLQRAICKVNILLEHGVISQEIGNNINNILDQSIEDIETLMASFC
ncbi:MAG: hypothetical protein R3255_06810 [Candidatus Lokiarchaeia archaeon]|nr:hypothetical protein [Candidatus Lokiarchaeia archaeon]